MVVDILKVRRQHQTWDLRRQTNCGKGYYFW